MSRYRNRIEIIADILNIVKEGARKTQIMYKGNLSYKLLTHYLEEVVGSGLVIVGENANIYQLSEKGLMFLKNFEDYSKNRVEVEQHMNTVRSLRARLDEMCVLKRIQRRGRVQDESEFRKDDSTQAAA